MTRETKIGLLVGLAFIIVFAIILSEKGPSGRNSSLPSFTVVDAAKPGGLAASDQRPLNNAGRLPVDSHLPPIVQPAIGVNPNMPLREEEVVQATPVGEDDLPPLPESVISLINGTLPANGGKQTLAQAAPPEKQGGSNQESKSEPLTTPIETPTLASHRPQAHEKTGEPSAPQTTLVSAGKEQPTVLPASAQTKFLTIKTVHEVHSGESLGKIAAHHYGTSTPTRVDAIYEANRELLKDRHVVKAGQKLKIPDLGEDSDSFESAPSFALSNVKDVPERGSDSKQPSPKTPKREQLAAAPNRSDDAKESADGLVRIPLPISDKSVEGKGAIQPDDSESKGLTRTVADSTETPKIPMPGKVKFRVYEVRPKDTLSGIARRELGSERLFSEIFRLNKDVLSNKNTLKPGMRLRLPEPSAASSDGRMILSSSTLGEVP